jgi:hypothetical protein
MSCSQLANCHHARNGLFASWPALNAPAPSGKADKSSMQKSTHSNLGQQRGTANYSILHCLLLTAAERRNVALARCMCPEPEEKAACELRYTHSTAGFPRTTHQTAANLQPSTKTSVRQAACRRSTRNKIEKAASEQVMIQSGPGCQVNRDFQARF